MTLANDSASTNSRDLDYALSRQGRAFPGDTRPGAKQIDPAGRRYTITGDSHVEWLGWSFDWSMHPLNGNGSILLKPEP